MHLKSGLIRMGLHFCNFSASEIWHDERLERWHLVGVD